MSTYAPICKYPGAKWSRAEWIISHFPPHKVYVEPYCGSGAVFFNKPPVEHEVINDLDKSIVNLFSVIRRRGLELAAQIEMTPWARAEYEMVERDYHGTGDELEDARRFLVRLWQAHGTRLAYTSGWRHKGVRGVNGGGDTVELWNKLPERLRAAISRLKWVEIECRPALDIIARYNEENVLIYADPPYPLALRSGAFYSHEMTNADHGDLLDVLLNHKAMIVLSGYANPLYDDALRGWYRVSKATQTEHGNTRHEVLWINPQAAKRQQLRLFTGPEEEEVSA